MFLDVVNCKISYIYLVIIHMYFALSQSIKIRVSIVGSASKFHTGTLGKVSNKINH